MKIIVITPGDRVGSNQGSMDYRLSLCLTAANNSMRPSIRSSRDFFAILGRGPRAFHIGKISAVNH